MWLPPSGGRFDGASGFSRKIKEERALPRQGAMHPYPKHLGGCDYRGARRYFLTFCTYERRPLFTSAAHVALVESHFLRTAGESGFADIAHCFMPDHLHAAVEGRNESADARAFIKRMKQFTGFYFKQTFSERLWQRYGYEHVIRDDETTAKVVRYVLENPVRAQLVATVAEYPFVGSSEYSLEQLLDCCRDSSNGSSA
jgi:putative transposase